MQTPDFKGTHLWDRLCWAKENLEPVQSDYRVVYEDSIDECAKILVPDPNWMACALAGWHPYRLCGCITNWLKMKPSQILRSILVAIYCMKLSQCQP